MEVTTDCNASAEQLKTVLESDASLSARVLRLVNSSTYGVRQRVGNLQTAIAYLGFRQIRNLALTSSISEVFKKDERIGTYSRPALWRHLVSVGVCARMLAMRRGLENFEDVFLAGLLHDVGIILEDQYDHDNFCRMVSSLTGKERLEEASRRELGYTHMELGGVVAEQWRFPDLATSAIRHHHDAVPPADEHQQANRCIQVANMVCTFKNISSVGLNLLKPPVDATAGLNLQRPDVEALIVDLDEELQRHSMLFCHVEADACSTT
jgi:HD-like signal output (HDOD) protein